MNSSSQVKATAKSAAIVSKPGKPELAAILPRLIAWLTAHNYKIIVDAETAVLAPKQELVLRENMAAHGVNLSIVLGGDGTLLSAARSLAHAGIPVLGVNLGSLGFLTEVPIEDLIPSLEMFDANQAVIQTRSMVHCEVLRKDICVAKYDALNDVVVGKGTIARLNHCDVYIDRIFVSSYQADSLIVSTPTGSTAYSLAAGGPIMMPAVEAMVITPVSAHSLTHRALVVPDTVGIEIVVKTDDQAYLSVDGQISIPLYDGDRVSCRKSSDTVKLLHFKGTFFDVLRTKLKWGQR
jgi:NAD+ kinase